MVLTSQFPNSGNSPFLKKSPNLFHGRKISVKGVTRSLGTSLPLNTEPCALPLPAKSFSRINRFHQFEFTNQISLSSAFFPQKDLSQKIPIFQSNSVPRDLRLVVHGSKGGQIHPLFDYIIQQI